MRRMARAVGGTMLMAAAFALLHPRPSAAEGPVSIQVTIRDHVFTPSEIVVPAHQRVVLIVRNEDATAEEFDSPDLRIEKVIAGHDSGTLRVRELDPGRYSFVGEYHSGTAKGVVIVK
jgi:plastocyanin